MSLGITPGSVPQFPTLTQSAGRYVYLNVLSPSNRKDFNMFTPRDIQPDEITTVEELKEEVFMQCGEDARLP